MSNYKTVTVIYNTNIHELPESHVMGILQWQSDEKPLTTHFTFTWEFAGGMVDESICDALFHVTNTQEGVIWDFIERLLPTNRRHTSLSVGDEVVVDGTIYRCEAFGWTKNDAMANFRRNMGVPVEA
jgi:hypothetical protein